jgi:CheY-like chemotaxis protein
MKAKVQTRKVLLIEREPVAREMLRALVNDLGCQGEVAADGREALAMIRRRNFDAVLLDLRSSSLPAEEVVAGIHDMRPSLIGRVLVVTGEVDGPETLDLIERYFLLQVRRSQVSFDVVDRLRALLRISPSPSGTTS